MRDDLNVKILSHHRKVRKTSQAITNFLLQNDMKVSNFMELHTKLLVDGNSHDAVAGPKLSKKVSRRVHCAQQIVDLQKQRELAKIERLLKENRKLQNLMISKTS